MRFVLLCLSVFLLAPPALGQQSLRPTTALEDRYQLNTGDVLRISVWREPELQRDSVIDPDGTISFPLVGRIQAAGQTLEEIEAEVGEKLQAFVPDAVVTVELLQPAGFRVYLIGEVRRPGEYRLTQPITILQALSIAGGFTSFAAEGSIRIVRQQEFNQETFLFDYNTVADGSVTTNFTLQSGDTVIVPQSFF